MGRGVDVDAAVVRLGEPVLALATELHGRDAAVAVAEARRALRARLVLERSSLRAVEVVPVVEPVAAEPEPERTPTRAVPWFLLAKLLGGAVVLLGVCIGYRLPPIVDVLVAVAWAFVCWRELRTTRHRDDAGRSLAVHEDVEREP